MPKAIPFPLANRDLPVLEKSRFADLARMSRPIKIGSVRIFVDRPDHAGTLVIGDFLKADVIKNNSSIPILEPRADAGGIAHIGWDEFKNLGLYVQEDSPDFALVNDLLRSDIKLVVKTQRKQKK